MCRERFVLTENKGEVRILDINNDSNENLELFNVNFEDNEECALYLKYELETMVRLLNEQDKELRKKGIIIP